MATLKRVVTNDPHKQMIQDNVEYALRSLQNTLGSQITANQSSTGANSTAISGIQSSIFQNGRLLTGVVLNGGTTTTVAHGLGRTPQIFVVCDINSNTSVWRSSWDGTNIVLNTTGTATVSLWVA